MSKKIAVFFVECDPYHRFCLDRFGNM